MAIENSAILPVDDVVVAITCVPRNTSFVPVVIKTHLIIRRNPLPNTVFLPKTFFYYGRRHGNKKKEKENDSHCKNVCRNVSENEKLCLNCQMKNKTKEDEE